MIIAAGSERMTCLRTSQFSGVATLMICKVFDFAVAPLT